MTGPSAPTTRKRESSGNFPDHAVGWDHPPPIAFPSSNNSNDNGGWALPRRLRWKTPQRLASLYPRNGTKSHHNEDGDTPIQQQNREVDATAAIFEYGGIFCAPLIVNDNLHVVVALGTTLFLYSSNDFYSSSETESSDNQCQLVPQSTDPIAQLSLAQKDEDTVGDVLQMVFHESSKILYVLTVDSFVYQVKIDAESIPEPQMSLSPSNAMPTQSTSASTTTPPAEDTTFKLMSRFHTKEYGVACMATIPNGSGKNVDIICIGYSSGIIEAWDVGNVHHHQPQQLLPSLSTSPPAIRRRPKTANATIRWRGYLHQSIRTLAFMSRQGAQLQQPDSEETPTKESPVDVDPIKPTANGAGATTQSDIAMHRHCLVVAMQMLAGSKDDDDRQPTSFMLEVLDLQRIFARTNSGDKIDDHENLPLQEFSIPLTPGMELVDSRTVPAQAEHLPKRSRALASPGADVVTMLCSDDKSKGTTNPRICLALPDGTITLLSCSNDPRMNGAVGIAEDFHQLLLSFPVIGNGCLKIPNANDHEYTSAAACCVRSGTCYIIPTDTVTEEVMAVPFPHDLSMDMTDIYVQAFTAGNLVIHGRSTPVLLYAWPSGVVDVYSFGLLQPKCEAQSTPKDVIPTVDGDDFIPRAERKALEELIDNGAVQTLYTLLEESREEFDHPLNQMKEWEEIWKQWPKRSNSSWTLEMLCSKEFRHIRHCLLSIAAGDFAV
ncbi:hypothetical protein IV203_016177 [Nitzschia inconspicua]|uniref:Uncharacterized protein n=1 Tax=Nitzschia inconspicua TaxID=303405 RepID=A0A9K3PH44_9STRA|nr:hypothetical protein IV203_016177 [Nitzschia inconspicua]